MQLSSRLPALGLGRILGILGVVLAVILYFKIPSTWGSVVAVFVGGVPLLLGVVKPILRKKFPSLTVDLDLTYLLQHMLCVSTGKPPRATLFRVVSEERLYPKYQEVFKRIHVLGKEWGYSFAEACRLVARSVENKVLREFLARLGGVLAVGEDVESFLRTEYLTMISEYETYYNRIVDALRMFLGVYTSLMAAGVFMLSNFLLLAFFFGGSMRILVASFAIIILTMGGAAALLFMLVPSDAFENKMKPRPRLLVLSDIAAVAGLACSLAFSMLIARNMGVTYTGLALALLATGACLLPAGVLAKTVERRIRDIDIFFPVFIRSYGMHLQTVPQMARALKPLLAAELGKLNKLLENLYARLVNNVDPRIAWRLFAAECGSELVRRAIRIFLDTVEKGGRVAEAGALLSDHHNTIVRLRRAKFQVAKTFETTTYMLHLAVVLIAVFITQLLQGFSSVLYQVQAQLPSELSGLFMMTSFPLKTVVMATTLYVLSLIFFNAGAITKATPGVSRCFWYYFAILSIISGAGVISGQELMRFIMGSTIETLNRTLIAP